MVAGHRSDHWLLTDVGCIVRQTCGSEGWNIEMVGVYKVKFLSVKEGESEEYL